MKVANDIKEALYFYDNKYAVACKEDRFYWINTRGEKIIELGMWEKVDQFEWNLAKVQKNGITYLLDG